MKKRCYICLPISGDEKTAICRANYAAKEVEKLGYNPLTPMEINDESQDTLDNPERPIEFFMGNDIKALIGDCDAIYMCKGWENSKGCNVEFECAKQYNKTIFYQESYIKDSFENVINNRYEKLIQEYRASNENYGPGSLEVNILKDKIDKYRIFMNQWFNYEIK